MEKTAAGTSVGVDDPYACVDRCDYLTDEGTCRLAIESPDRDPDFAARRRQEDYRCPVAGDPDESGPTGPWDWADCPHFRCRNRDWACFRCGLDEQRMAHEDTRPLLEEHHLSYAGETDGDSISHEITVFLCRWCHSKVHDSWARIDDDVNPDAAAIAAREERRARLKRELGFDTAAERAHDDASTGDE